MWELRVLLCYHCQVELPCRACFWKMLSEARLESGCSGRGYVPLHPDLMAGGGFAMRPLLLTRMRAQTSSIVAHRAMLSSSPWSKNLAAGEQWHLMIKCSCKIERFVKLFSRSASMLHDFFFPSSSLTFPI